jgi:hypothetical protein
MGNSKTYSPGNFHVGNFLSIGSIIVYTIRGGVPGGPAQSIFHATLDVTSLGFKSGHHVNEVYFAPPMVDGFPTAYNKSVFKAAPINIGFTFLGQGGGAVESGKFNFPYTLNCGDNKKAVEFTGTFQLIEDFDLILSVYCSAGGTFVSC